MTTALLIIERHNGLAFKETQREVRNVVDILASKERSGNGNTEGIYFSRFWCKSLPVKIERRNLEGKDVRFTWIWQENDRLIPVRYWHGE